MNDKETVPFVKKDVKEYLDECIIFWRQKKNFSESNEEKEMAVCYIDAFQSVRTSLFNETLKKVKNV